MHSISGVTHIAVRVSDMDRALAFYRDLLGYQIVRDITMDKPEMQKALGQPGLKVRATFMRKDALAMIELVQILAPEKVRPAEKGLPIADIGGVFTLVMGVTNLDKIYTDLSAKGVEFLSEPVVYEDEPGLGRAIQVLCRDPDGTLIEFLEVQASGT